MSEQPPVNPTTDPNNDPANAAGSQDPWAHVHDALNAADAGSATPDQVTLLTQLGASMEARPVTLAGAPDPDTGKRGPDVIEDRYAVRGEKGKKGKETWQPLDPELGQKLVGFMAIQGVEVGSALKGKQAGGGTTTKDRPQHKRSTHDAHSTTHPSGRDTDTGTHPRRAAASGAPDRPPRQPRGKGDRNGSRERSRDDRENPYDFMDSDERFAHMNALFSAEKRARRAAAEEPTEPEVRRAPSGKIITDEQQALIDAHQEQIDQGIADRQAHYEAMKPRSEDWKRRLGPQYNDRMANSPHVDPDAWLRQQQSAGPNVTKVNANPGDFGLSFDEIAKIEALALERHKRPEFIAQILRGDHNYTAYLKANRSPEEIAQEVADKQALVDQQALAEKHFVEARQQHRAELKEAQELEHISNILGKNKRQRAAHKARDFFGSLNPNEAANYTPAPRKGLGRLALHSLINRPR